MSMYRQLWLALIVSTLLALIGSLLASTVNTRAYLQEQLRTKNADTASALALTLSRKNVDAIEIELAVAALFDRGHYQLIRVTDPIGQVIAERSLPAAELGVPGWFANNLRLDAAPGMALVSDGWKQVGQVAVISNSGLAYRALWTSTTRMSAALLIAGLIGAYLGTLILRRLKRPLDSVVEQARAISERRFVTMPEPRVPELRQLAVAMNSAVTRLKSMFDEEAQRLESLRRDANHDALTGLTNRAYFMARLRAAVDAEESPPSSLFLIRVANLAEINRRLGRAATDELLKSVGRQIHEFAQPFPEGLAARLNGADFGLLLPGHSDSTSSAHHLLDALVSDMSAFTGDGAAAFIGAGQFSFGIDSSALLSQVDAALASAEAAGINGVHQAAPFSADSGPHSAEQWAQMIQHSLERRWVRLVSFPVADFTGRLVHRECPLRLMLGDEGEWLPAGRFLPIAERLGLTVELDLSAVRLGLEELSRDPDLPGLAVNISARSIQEITFRKKLRALLAAKPNLTRRLWLEVTEHGALAHFETFRDFCHELKFSGCKLGLEHFGRQFSQIGRLHNLGLDYLKVDASFIRGIESNPGNQVFLKGLTGIAHNIGMQVFAEGVVSVEEMQGLAALGFDGMTGQAIQDSD